MGLLRDAVRMLPFTAMIAGAISLAYIGGCHLGKDESLEIQYDEDNEYNHDNYPELYENYEEYVRKIGESLKECNEERKIVRDFAFYMTMLDNGYISYGYDFNGGALPVEFADALGATIANGNGVCRHAADNLADVLCSIGYDAKVVVGKSYVKGEEKPSFANHAVVYVVEDGVGYLLDPINGTIFLKKIGLLYYDIRSQEDTFVCFEPVISYNPMNDSESNNAELLSNLGNDFKKHWDILKKYKEYLECSDEYLTYFWLYEVKQLLENEKNIKIIFDDLINEYNNPTGKDLDSVKLR